MAPSVTVRSLLLSLNSAVAALTAVLVVMVIRVFSDVVVVLLPPFFCVQIQRLNTHIHTNKHHNQMVILWVRVTPPAVKARFTVCEM